MSDREAVEALRPPGASNTTTLIGDDAGALGHSHLWFCQCSDPSIPRHICPAATPSPDAGELARAIYMERWGEWPPRDGMDSFLLKTSRAYAERLLSKMAEIPDQHPEDPPEHPDDARMREEDRG